LENTDVLPMTKIQTASVQKREQSTVER